MLSFFNFEFLPLLMFFPLSKFLLWLERGTYVGRSPFILQWPSQPPKVWQPCNLMPPTSGKAPQWVSRVSTVPSFLLSSLPLVLVTVRAGSDLCSPLDFSFLSLSPLFLLGYLVFYRYQRPIRVSQVYTEQERISGYWVWQWSVFSHLLREHVLSLFYVPDLSSSLGHLTIW